MIIRFTFILLSLTLFSCLEVPNQFEKLPPGKWRAVLKITDQDQVVQDNATNEEQALVDNYFELPFNLDVEYDNEELKMYVLNGEERILVDELNYGRDPATAKDTLQINFKAFDTKIDAFYEENYIEGYWTVPYRNEGKYKIPFIAKYGEDHRFQVPPNIKETYDFSGEWKVTFEYDKPEESYPAIGVFEQNNTDITGTFKTETGDYRYLQGNAYGDKLRLSVFDGAHAFLFSGSASQDTIYGEFRSGKHYKSKWIAVRDNNFELTDPYEMTQTLENKKVDFEFPNIKKELVNINDKQFNDRYKLINVMGTWCPNCRDEIHFLKEIKNHYEDIDIVTIAFERYRDEDKSLEVMRRYKTQMDFDWPFLLGGYANKTETTEVLGFVDKIYSYPTLILADKENNIIDIHTGFYGPATQEYADFKSTYLDKLNKLN